MYAYVAKQPILNRNKQHVGDELLFRDGVRNCFPHDIEANVATCRLLVENFIASNPKESKGSLDAPRCFINFPYESLVKLVPTLLPKDQIVIEILEDAPPDDPLFEAIKNMHQQGYVIALDDFIPSNKWARFFPYIHIIKIDIEQYGLDKACRYAKKIKENKALKIKMLAERVETYDQFRKLRLHGYNFYQGYFFGRPEVLKNAVIELSQLTAVELLHEANKEEFDFDRVERIIARDVSLSYLLLKFVNNDTISEKAQIESLKQAFVYLGEDKAKRFINVVGMAHASQDKPKALYNLSLSRALACGALAKLNLTADHYQEAFLSGLLSVLDALFDCPMDNILRDLSLNNEIEEALIHHSGTLGMYLTLIKSIEKGDWAEVSEYCKMLIIDEDKVIQSYNNAQKDILAYY